MNEPPSSPVCVQHQWRMLDFNRENNWRCSAWFGALFSPSMLITLTWIAFPRIEIESHLSLHMLHVFGTASLQVGVNDENRDA